MESKTPNLDKWINERDLNYCPGLLREAVAKDIAALEVATAEELRRREDSYQEALIKLQNRNDAVLEEIARARCEAYEDAIGIIRRWVSTSGRGLEDAVKVLREKAGKL